MNKYKIDYSPEAKKEIDEIIGLIACDSGETIAAKHKKRIKSRIGALGTIPNAGQRIDKNFLKIPVKPYIVIYKIEKDVVKIMGVIDGRRDWQRIFFATLISRS